MQGAASGVVRYKAQDLLEKVLEGADSEGKLEIAGFTATVRKLEGGSPVVVLLKRSALFTC